MAEQSKDGLDLHSETLNRKSSCADRTSLAAKTLEERLDKALLETTCKRRDYPLKIKTNLAQEYNCSLNQLVQTKIHFSGDERLSEGHSASELCPLSFKKSTEEKLNKTFSTLSSLPKSLPIAVDCAERLEKSYRMYATLAACSTQRIIHHSEPEEDKMAASMTPLRRRLEYSCQTPPGRIPQSKLNQHKCFPKTQLLHSTCTELISTQRRSTRLKDNL